MRTKKRNSWLVLLHILLGSLLLFGTYGFAAAANPADDPFPGNPEDYAWTAPSLPQGPNGVLPATTCFALPQGRTCLIAALTGSVVMPDSTPVDIWGFSAGPTTPPTLLGPTIIANQNENMNILLFNVLGQPVSIIFPGVETLVPDRVGSAGLANYLFSVPQPGTYIYQAGLTENGPKQVGMGLYGAMIVRPAGAPNQLYSDPATAFDSEALLVFSEVDAELHQDPVNFNLPNYKPEYWLINGEAYQDIPNIQVDPGDTLALRLVNAGLQERAVNVLGLDQTLVAIDGNPYPYTTTVTAHTMGAGTSTDVLVQIPADAPEGALYPVYNPGFAQMHNAGDLAADGSVGFGGILTFIEVSGGTPVSDVGPWASGVSVTPDLVAPTTDVVLEATLDETNTGLEDVTAAEYFTETLGAPGTGIAIPIATPGVTVNVSATIPSTTLAAWTPGDVIFYVRGQDASGDWGPVGSAVLDLVVEGPLVKSLSLTPAVGNGTQDVEIRGTADDRPTGQVDVDYAEYDIAGITDTLTLNKIAPLVGLSGIIPAATIDSLAEGTYSVMVSARDVLGNFGMPGEVPFVVDKTGPGAVGVSVGPNPNNGTLSIHSSVYAVRVRATFTDLSSNVVDAEAFIDTIGPDGSGIPFIANDGLFDEQSEAAYFDLALTTVRLMTDGTHQIYFHGLDEAGNWNDTFASLSLTVDKAGPTTSGLTLTNLGVDALYVTANAADAATNIVAAEWFEGSDPGLGQGTPMLPFDGGFNSLSETVWTLINTAGWTSGNHLISVRSKDAAGNWGPVVSGTYNVTAATADHILLDSFEEGDLYSAWNYATPNTYASFTANMVGEFGMRAIIRDGKPAYIVDRTPTSEATYRAAFLFNPSDMKDATDPVDFFVGESDDGAQVFGMQYERSASGSEVRAWMMADGDRVYTEWVSVADAAQRLELMWKSDASGSLRLFVDGGLKDMVDGDTSAHMLDTVKLGPSGGLADGVNGSMAFDEFESYRPIPGDDLPYQLFLPSILGEVTQ